MYHAQNACELVKNHPSSNETLLKVLMEHHGAIDGVGYIDDPSEDLHPISKVFIISDAFVKILLDPDQTNVKEEIIPILEERFNSPTYIKILRVLEQKMN